MEQNEKLEKEMNAYQTLVEAKDEIIFKNKATIAKKIGKIDKLKNDIDNKKTEIEGLNYRRVESPDWAHDGLVLNKPRYR